MRLGMTDDKQLFHETTVRFADVEAGGRTWRRRSAELGCLAMLVTEADAGGRRRQELGGQLR
jgi:hypothetical protein